MTLLYQERKAITLIFDKDVAQHVAQQGTQKDLINEDNSIKNLEKRINSLEAALVGERKPNGLASADASPINPIQDGLVVIRTRDLRRVKATS